MSPYRLMFFLGWGRICPSTPHVFSLMCFHDVMALSSPVLTLVQDVYTISLSLLV